MHEHFWGQRFISSQHMHTCNSSSRYYALRQLNDFPGILGSLSCTNHAIPIEYHLTTCSRTTLWLNSRTTCCRHCAGKRTACVDVYLELDWIMATCSSLITTDNCAICLETFCDPRALPCQHEFCRECLEQCVVSSQDKKTLICPTCREEVNISKDQVKNLPASSVDMEKKVKSWLLIGIKCYCGESVKIFRFWFFCINLVTKSYWKRVARNIIVYFCKSTRFNYIGLYSLYI